MMLTEHERINNALKEMLFHEEQMAKKHAQLAQQITEPQIQTMLQNMEQAARSHYSTLSQKMGSLGIMQEG